jgi:hypothetical protein
VTHSPRRFQKASRRALRLRRISVSRHGCASMDIEAQNIATIC